MYQEWATPGEPRCDLSLVPPEPSRFLSVRVETGRRSVIYKNGMHFT